MVVLLVHIQRGNHEISSSPVDSHGYVVYLGDSHQSLYVRVMRLGGKRVGKEYDKINDPFHNLGSYLLVSPQRAAVISLNPQARLVGNQSGRGARTVKIMLFQDFTMVLAPLDNLRLFIVMSYQCNIFLFLNGKCHVIIIHIFPAFFLNFYTLVYRTPLHSLSLTLGTQKMQQKFYSCSYTARQQVSGCCMNSNILS